MGDVNAGYTVENSTSETNPSDENEGNIEGVVERMNVVDQGTAAIITTTASTTEQTPIKPIKRLGKDQKIDLATLNMDWHTLISLARNLVDSQVAEVGANEGHWIENKQYLPTSFTKMPWDEHSCPPKNFLTTSAVDTSPSVLSSASQVTEPSVAEEEKVRESIFDCVPEIALRLPHPHRPSNTILLRMENPTHSHTDKDSPRTLEDEKTQMWELPASPKADKDDAGDCYDWVDDGSQMLIPSMKGEEWQVDYDYMDDLAMDNMKRKKYYVNRRYSGFVTNTRDTNQSQIRLAKKKRRDLPLLTVKEALAIVDEADRDDQERTDKLTKDGGLSTKGVKRGRNWTLSNCSTQRETKFLRELVLKQITSMMSLVPYNEHQHQQQQQQEPSNDANLPTDDLLEL